MLVGSGHQLLNGTSPVTVGMDEATAAIVLSAAAPWLFAGSQEEEVPQEEQEHAEEEEEEEKEEDELESQGQHVNSRGEWRLEERPWNQNRARNREAQDYESDIVVVTTKDNAPGSQSPLGKASNDGAAIQSPGTAASRRLGDIAYMEGSEAGASDGDGDYNDAGARLPSSAARGGACSGAIALGGGGADAATGTSTAQVRSVHLLHQLALDAQRSGQASVDTEADLRVSSSLNRMPFTRPLRGVNGRPRPRSVQTVNRIEEAQRSGIRSSPSKVGKPDRQRSWDDSYYCVSQRRIPAYDSLIDDHCPLMGSPNRLRHLIKTRELHDQYLYIVRSRFEKHRRLFGRDGRFGEHLRPVRPPSPEDENDPSRVPQYLGMRMSELEATSQSGTPRPWVKVAIGGDDEPPPATSALPPRVPPSLACSPDWCTSALHDECLRNPEIPIDPFSTDDVSVHDHSTVSSHDLGQRFEHLRGRIQMLWYKLQIPVAVRDAIEHGPFATVTPGSLYQLEMHLKELIAYHLRTRSIITDWLERETLLETIKHAHALGVNDGRLEKLMGDLRRLEDVSKALLSACGAWSRRFGPMAVDVTKVQHLSLGGALPRAIFVWAGRDMAERIQSDSHALSRGDSHLAGVNGVVARPGSRRQASQDERKHRQSVVSGSGAAAVSARRRPCPLVASALMAQRYGPTDVLHQGPPPPWYSQQVAEAGIKAIRRGVMCGGGEKRL
eukprot:TRINITY_DN17715_c0_g2_i1.p1 TRINITY_DN17715_c0_g2~~TRINITY_DN17715_c0_g2_i1.p1  ORF type:complete len:840 (-),score=177.97 TRINITY_DN17715_c0_g2_i1:136-2307(-)